MPMPSSLAKFIMANHLPFTAVAILSLSSTSDLPCFFFFRADPPTAHLCCRAPPSPLPPFVPPSLTTAPTTISVPSSDPSLLMTAATPPALPLCSISLAELHPGDSLASPSLSSPSFPPSSFRSGHQDRVLPSPPAPSSPHRRCPLLPLHLAAAAPFLCPLQSPKAIDPTPPFPSPRSLPLLSLRSLQPRLRRSFFAVASPPPLQTTPPSATTAGIVPPC